MPDSTLAGLTAAAALGASDLFYVVQGGADRKATGTQVAALSGAVSDPYDFDTKASVVAASVSGSANYIRIAGYTTVGDGGGARYRRVGSQPGHALKIQSADGAWWEWNDIILTPEMGGAVGDGAFSDSLPGSWTGTDNTVALQNCIDACIYFGLAVELAFLRPKAVYRTTGPLHLGYGINNFSSFRMRGAIGVAFRAEINQCAVLLCDFNNAPALAISGGRSVRIEGIALRGRNWDWCFNHVLGAVAGVGAPGGPTIDDTIATNWVDSGFPAASSSRTAPYCAIAVDPYAGSIPATAYPNVNVPTYAGGPVAQYNRGFSSDVMINECYIGGFVVGVITQPSGADGNGDFLKIRNTNIEYCRQAVAVCQDQARANAFENLNISDCFCIYDGVTYGMQSGKTSGVWTNCAAGECINVINIGSTSVSGPLIFTQFYIEAGWRIGDINPGSGAETGVIFDACQFSFDGQNDFRGVPVSVLGTFNQPANIMFRGGVFSNFIRVASIMMSPSDEVMFDGTLMQSAFIANATTPLTFQALAHNATGGGLVMAQLGNLSARGRHRLKFTQYNVDNLVPDSAQIAGPRQQFADRPHCACAWVEKAVPRNGVDEEGVWIPKQVSFIDKTQITSPAFDTVGKKLTFNMPAGFTATQFALLGPSNGDVLWDDQTGTVFWVRGVSGLQVICELQNNYKSSGGGNFSHPTAISLNTGNFYVLNSRLYTPTSFTRGSFSSSSSLVTSVGDAQGNNSWVTNDIKPGDYVLNDDIRDDTLNMSSGNTKLTAVAATQLTMTGAAVTTLAKRRLAWFIRAPHANE